MDNLWGSITIPRLIIVNKLKYQNLNYIFIAVHSLHLHEQDDATLEQYQDILTDPHKRHDHMHIIKLLQTDDALTKDLERLQKTTYEFKLLQTTGQKIKVLMKFEANEEFSVHYFRSPSAPIRRFLSGSPQIKDPADFILFKKHATICIENVCRQTPLVQD